MLHRGTSDVWPVWFILKSKQGETTCLGSTAPCNLSVRWR
jgi:hypothetical protein